MYWLKDVRFPSAIELEEPKGTRERMAIYGINETMIENCCAKGARYVPLPPPLIPTHSYPFRDAVSGTYRSVCFQIRREHKEMEDRVRIPYLFTLQMNIPDKEIEITRRRK